MTVVGDVAYVADGTDGTQALRILDIVDPTSPSLLGSYQLAGGIDGVTVVGDRAYLGNYWQGLQVLSVADPTAPTVLGSFAMPSGVRAVAISGDLAAAINPSLGLQMVNIADPTALTLVGRYDTPNPVTSLSVAGDLTCAANGSWLQIFQRSDATTAHMLVNYQIPNGTLGASALSLVGDLVYVACYDFLASDSGSLLILNISDPTAPALVGSYHLSSAATGVSVVGDLAYVTCGDLSLQILNIADPTAPSFVGSGSLPDYPLGISVAGDFAYVASTYSGLQVLNVADPTAPGIVGSYATPGYSYGVSVLGNLAYVADYSSLQILDITDPAAPKLLKSYPTAPGAQCVSAAGDLVYVSISGVLQVFRNPSAVSSIIPVDETTYRLQFTNALANGGYALAIGPQIADAEGALLDQDQDGQGGERTDDTFHAAWWSGECPSVQLLLSSNSVTEHRPVGTVVGSFSSSAADLNSTFTYQLVSGAGDTDNASLRSMPADSCGRPSRSTVRRRAATRSASLPRTSMVSPTSRPSRLRWSRGCKSSRPPPRKIMST